MRRLVQSFGTGGRAVCVRRAVRGDYSAVMAILPGGLYHGADYMAVKYPSYFSDPCAFPVVAEVGGKVVGFSTHCVVDGGRSAVVTGSRTAPDHQGAGLLNTLRQVSLTAARGCYPGVTREVGSVFEAPYHERYRRSNQKGYRVIYERTFLQFMPSSEQVVRLSDILESESKPHPSQVVHLSDDPADQDVLCGSALLADPSLLLLHDYLPLTVNEHNLRWACRHTDAVVIRDLSGEGGGSMSFGSCLILPRGPSLVVVLHVHSVLDLLHHLQVHLARSRPAFSRPGAATLELTFPETLEVTEVKETLTPVIGPSALYDDVQSERVLIVERPLND